MVIDTSSQLNDKTLTVLDSADFILVVGTPELPSIKSTKLFLELADQLEFAAHRLGVVINRATLPGGISPDKIEKALKLAQAYRIPYDPKLHLAINKGTALTQQEPGHLRLRQSPTLPRICGKSWARAEPFRSQKWLDPANKKPRETRGFCCIQPVNCSDRPAFAWPARSQRRERDHFG
ncbi:MAG: hypothetical protein HC875_28195 [Anaerolineales bacterium]|nr:hypothetical protein [Anaerolineales bacterium]